MYFDPTDWLPTSRCEIKALPEDFGHRRKEGRLYAPEPCWCPFGSRSAQASRGEEHRKLQACQYGRTEAQ